ncbi:LysE family transporter [Flagellimonas sp. CMM7]|uniref:LysE family transporter n=1 Tax=Flagellimonas sp. CMM7 TaxID=2654676 RepID=UPI0013D5A17A|nr:LysE family transporter [Flagellimonas sp. CMM7]UII80309.1 hypothetical protein LV704_02065 [Flagellimonas sp. CMM7]
MNKLIRIGFTGFLISFLGSLPLGTLNVTAFHIAVFEGVNDLIWFALAVVLIELVVVRITLNWSSNTLDLRNRAFLYIMPVAVLVLFYLSISSFMLIGEKKELGADLHLIPMIKSFFLLGLLLSALNPMHFPFWLGWNSFLKSKQLLNTNRGMYFFYLFGIGTGSSTGLFVFILTGQFIFKNIQQYNYIISFIMGCLYLGFSLYMLFIFYKNHFKPIPIK